MPFSYYCREKKLILGFLCLFSLSLSVGAQFATSSPWFLQRNSHQAQLVSTRQLQVLAGLSNMQQFDQILNPILVPRVVGSKNHAQVKQYLKDSMKGLGWQVESDVSTQNTPVGQKTFENIIATLNPQAPRRLVLACHFDSKPSAGDTFIGATDSAVPCAMMINLARDMAPLFNQQNFTASDVTLQLVFFDGEEAFVSWTDTDSIYGSRNLAAKWASKPFPDNSREGTSHLHRIDLMVLLDLLGAPNPTFYSYIPSGERWFQHMANVEARLKQNRLITNGQSYFSFESVFGGIEDDHIPFMQRGVPILHLIPSPFPDVWHTDADNKSALDYQTIDNLNKILRVFVAEYLKLSVPAA